MISYRISDISLKVLIAHISLNTPGGGELVCLSMIKALSMAGHEVTLATVDKTDWQKVKKSLSHAYTPIKEIYIFSKLPEMRLTILNSFLLTGIFLLELILLKFLRKWDIVVNTCGEKLDSIADIAYINGFPVRCAFFLPNAKPIRQCYSILYNLLLKVLDKTSPSVIVVNSKFSYRAINACFKKKAILVYPPVNLHRICDLINVKKRNNVVLVYSQYTLTQNLQIVPKIAKYVQKGDFVIFGPYGAESSKTINTLYRTANNLLVRKRVNILVDQPFQKFKDLLFEAKVFLRTLPYEPFGISVVEAMAAGCVPVVPRCGGPWFDILDCKQGVYGFSYGSIGEAADIIDRLLEDDVLRECVASRARERALMFDSSIFEKKILDVVDKVYRLKFAR